MFAQLILKNIWIIRKLSLILHRCLTPLSNIGAKLIMDKFKLGIDIGSTTIKMVLLETAGGSVVCEKYQRHCAKVVECLRDFLEIIKCYVANNPFSVTMTGSVGMGIAERYKIPFVQEVVAAANYIQSFHSNASSMIDIGGEDAKMVFFKNGTPTDLRMNGNCAGGTGAFIDQMAVLLNVTTSELDALAKNAKQIYPIASRCGVFSKTDIQNLIARNAANEDIAASIFHAVAVQTITTLAHGHEVSTPIVLCGGPLTFIESLRTAFSNYLKLDANNFIIPEKSHLIPAWGAALSENGISILSDDFIRLIDTKTETIRNESVSDDVLFKNSQEYEIWKQGMSRHHIPFSTITKDTTEVYIGIDSGSTTTKIAVIDKDGQLLYSYYRNNGGNPVGCVESGLKELKSQCDAKGITLNVVGSCSTGYGEDLIKSAFGLNDGIVETMAHYIAAKNLDNDVSFILDIGGQDMKAMFIENGSLARIEVNEACSSGCGSFISTFAETLGCTIGQFAEMACLAPNPCDLGTRCTVFMNSKVKQVLREGSSIENIAAGLSYSVIKNCLYKVLRLKDTVALGEHIVVQGGTMRNDSIVRVLEKLSGKQVIRCDCPELMGAIGCALYSMKSSKRHSITLDEMLSKAGYTTSVARCHGCENKCAITRYRFDNGNVYFSGNRCEKIFTNKGNSAIYGQNAYEKKRSLIFDRDITVDNPVTVIGIPRCLNTYEEYPFWHTLLSECGIQVVLSDNSTYPHYEQCVGKVMSDNICFPAKLVHSHIANLIEKKADRIFMPFVVFEKKDRQMQNSYNCPIVTGYSQVVKSVQQENVPIDTPVISFKDVDGLYLQCMEYLRSIGISSDLIKSAFKKALKEQNLFEQEIVRHNHSIIEEARENNAIIVMLAGRPYHSDALIQHKVSEMIASQGVYVITDDLIRDMEFISSDQHYLSQWAFTNRIMKAAKWVADQDHKVQYIQLTSFGCGPDAFLIDEIRNILSGNNKNLTLLKIDDVNNIGSLKLRVRSLIESLGIGMEEPPEIKHKTTGNLPAYTAGHIGKKIIVPFFTPYLSPLIPTMMKLAGYDVDNLPMSDTTSCEWGLKYSNNEVCYPATLIVGDIVNAFRSGRYDPDNTCVAITQTGGQCRASNYISILRKALVDNGYTNTPVISISLGSGINNEQPGFKINWLKMLPAILDGILFSDCIAKFYYSSVVRENVAGEAKRLADYYLSAAASAISEGKSKHLYVLLEQAVHDFNSICKSESHDKVGIVGEIFLKFHPFAQKNVTDWLVAQGLEIAYPTMIDFFLQGFINTLERKKKHLSHKYTPAVIVKALHKIVFSTISKVNLIGSKFKYFSPFENIFEKAELARPIISLSAQFGEGWLIAGEIASLARQGITHVVSLQPFGCIANHIVQKGIENKIKALYPQINILSLDFDSSVSDVNITNRLLLFINNIKHK